MSSLSELKRLGERWIRRHKDEILEMLHNLRYKKAYIRLTKLDWLEKNIGECIQKLGCEDPEIVKIWVMTSPVTSVSLVSAILACNGKRTRCSIAKSLA